MEVKRRVSSLATSGVTALDMLAPIPTDVASRCSAHFAFPFYSGVIYNECGRGISHDCLHQLHYKQLIIMSGTEKAGEAQDNVDFSLSKHVETLKKKGVIL